MTLKLWKVEVTVLNPEEDTFWIVAETEAEAEKIAERRMGMGAAAVIAHRGVPQANSVLDSGPRVRGLPRSDEMTPEQWATFKKELVRQLAEGSHHHGRCDSCGFRFAAELAVGDCAMCGCDTILPDREQANEHYDELIEHAFRWATTGLP